MKIQLWCDFLTLLDGVFDVIGIGTVGQWDIFTLVGPLDFVGTGGWWQWVVVVDGDGGWCWLVMVVAGDSGGW